MIRMFLKCAEPPLREIKSIRSDTHGPLNQMMVRLMQDLITNKNEIETVYLLNRHRFRQITRLIHIRTLQHRHMVSE